MRELPDEKLKQQSLKGLLVAGLMVLVVMWGWQESESIDDGPRRLNSESNETMKALLLFITITYVIYKSSAAYATFKRDFKTSEHYPILYPQPDKEKPEDAKNRNLNEIVAVTKALKTYKTTLGGIGTTYGDNLVNIIDAFLKELNTNYKSISQQQTLDSKAILHTTARLKIIKEIFPMLNKAAQEETLKQKNKNQEIKLAKKKFQNYESQIDILQRQVSTFNADNSVLAPLIEAINNKIASFLTALTKERSKLEEVKEQPQDYKITNSLETELNKISQSVQVLTEKAADQEKISAAKDTMVTTLKKLYDLDFPKETEKFIQTPITLPIVSSLQRAIFDAPSTSDITEANECRTDLITQVQELNRLKENITKLINSPDPSSTEIIQVKSELEKFSQGVKDVMPQARRELHALQSEKKPRPTSFHGSASSYFQKAMNADKKEQQKPKPKPKPTRKERHKKTDTLSFP